MNFYKAIQKRRTNYTITNETTITDARLEEIVMDMVKYTPSSFHSQSSRVVLLLGEKHKTLWEIVMQTLKAIVPVESFAATESKINSFAAGYGTILYFEDQDVVKGLQESFPAYKDNFPVWSNQSSGMLQANIWTALTTEGLGVSLQHYNPIIDVKVAQTFDIPTSWKLIAQMPFGVAATESKNLEYKVAGRVRVIK